MSTLSETFKHLLGPKGWIAPEDSSLWQQDWLGHIGQSPIGVACPKSSLEVSKVLKICYLNNIHVVPQGGNTGLVGASILDKPGGIILSLGRMKSISSVDKVNRSLKVEAGVILGDLHSLLEGSGFIFPMHLGSEGSAQIGGLIATNAGGNQAFRYGMMQDLILGLEVVLADGSIWNGMRSVQKDNTGYQLKKLFCGSEGTIGVVTKAVLKLSREPIKYETAIFAIENPENLVKLSTKFRLEAEEFLNAIEFFSNTGLDIALEYIPSLKFPLTNKSNYYLLVELASTSHHVPLDNILSDLIEWGYDKNLVIDGTIAATKAQRTAIWQLRENQPEGQRLMGVQLKHDISIPLNKFSEFLNLASKLCSKMLKDVIINPFGHMGDGNVHYNLSPPNGKKDFDGLNQDLSFLLSSIAQEMSGSFAAEHGLGRSKIFLADILRDPIEREMIHKVKSALDSKNQLNPGVVVSS